MSPIDGDTNGDTSMTDTFKIGDVVQLKSGGPRMTVTGLGDSSTTGEASVYCTWFVDKKQDSGAFPVEAVAHVETARPAVRRTPPGGSWMSR